jgi:hypothetical protein
VASPTIEIIGTEPGDHYSTPQAWFDAHVGDIKSDPNAPYIGEMRAGIYPVLAAVGTPGDCDATHYLHLRAIAGAEFKGDFDGSYPVITSGTTSTVSVRHDYMRLSNFVVTGDDLSLGAIWSGVHVSNGPVGVLLDTIGVWSMTVVKEVSVLTLFGINVSGASEITIRNCCIGRLSATNTKPADNAHVTGIFINDVGTVVSLFNNAIEGLHAASDGPSSTWGIEARTNSEVVIVNNVIGTITGDLGACIDASEASYSLIKYNATTDASGGSNSQDNITPANVFADITLTTLDLHMKTGGVTDGKGLDLVAEGYAYAPTLDCDGDVRAFPWSIGPDGSSWDAWPVYVNDLPDEPGNCIGVFDTVGTQDSRTMRGNTQDRPGVQIRVRGTGHQVAYVRAYLLESLVDTIQRTLVSMDSGNTYQIDVFSRSGPIVRMGPDDEGRANFSINGRLVCVAATSTTTPTP